MYVVYKYVYTVTLSIYGFGFQNSPWIPTLWGLSIIEYKILQ